jgi:phage gp36-like protein
MNFASLEDVATAIGGGGTASLKLTSEQEQRVQQALENASRQVDLEIAKRYAMSAGGEP